MPDHSVVPLLPLPVGLVITAIVETADVLLVHVTSARSTSFCPLCYTPSCTIHSHYCRKRRDLTCAGQPIRLLLHVRKFFCQAMGCRRKIFTERIPELLPPSSRLTTRLRTALQHIGFACNGKGGARLATSLGMRLSDTTLLWSLQLGPSPTPLPDQLRVIGIDDWSWLRGQRYGTLIVDLERHRPVEVLADRDTKSVSAWLAAHPQVEIVSRDRATCYAEAISQGAPQAIQIADRWHLYKNLGDAVEAFLVRAQVHVAAVASTEQASGALQPAGPQVKVAAGPPAISDQPGRRKAARDRLRRKWELQQRVHELHSQGVGMRRIAVQLSLAHNTVRKYARLPVPVEPPEPTPRPPRASKLDDYEEFLRQRWAEGCRNAALLFRELKERGFNGGKSIVRDYAKHLRANLGQADQRHPRRERARSASPREIRWLLAREPQDLGEEDQARLERLLTTEADFLAEVNSVYGLVQRFHKMVQQKRPEELDAWLAAAKGSGIAEMKSYASGIERDYAAVRAGIEQPWSHERVAYCTSSPRS
jgi:transposase